jgi:hypothetical protein
MRRVTRPGGTIAVSAWAAEHPLGLFGAMNEALREVELDASWPDAETATAALLGTPFGPLVSAFPLTPSRSCEHAWQAS